MAEQMDKPQKSAIWEVIVVAVQALVLALVLRTVAIQPFTIPSGSMMPTLLIGDYIIVNKFAYGYSKYSLPLVNPDAFKGRLFGSEPARGDVIVFRLPPNPDIDYIKRVIGLPGDRIQMKDGVLHINGTAVPKVTDGTFTSDDSREPGDNVPVFRETLDNGVSYESLDLYPSSEGDNTREFIVPPDHYFMMGDNRDNSADSRFEVGYVPAENLVGRASFIMFSLGNATPFLNFWEWPANLRYDRFFKGIQ